MYEKFYAKQFNGRKLTWLHHLSNGDIKLGYLSKTYIINMTTFQVLSGFLDLGAKIQTTFPFQMSILLLFEKSDSLSYNELKNATKISDDQFPRHVQSLIDATLLKCSTKELTDESVIGLNMKYSNKRTKFRIAGTVQKETPQEVEQTHHAVEEDRKMYLQAAIVRIMKSRKVLKHNQLIQEVQNSFKFFWILVV